MKASIIGTGFGSRVVEGMYKKAGIDVVDVVSPRDSQGVKRACTARVDFVSIHSPPFLHKEHVFLALENKRNIVCEKPFGQSAYESREMLDAAKAAKVIHLVNFEFRYEPARVKAKELIDQGAIGTPHHIQWNSIMGSLRTPLKPYGWLFDRDLGGGWIGAFGSHAIDAMRWWIGDIKDVMGICRTEIAERADTKGVSHACSAEDAFTACFTFHNGATGTLNAASSAAVTRPYEIEILGSEGALRMNFGSELDLLRTDKNDEHFKFDQGAGGIEAACVNWARAVQNAILEGRQISPSFSDGLACAELMDKLKAGATWVTQTSSLR